MNYRKSNGASYELRLAPFSDESVLRSVRRAALDPSEGTACEDTSRRDSVPANGVPGKTGSPVLNFGRGVRHRP